jgi:hypothetical protein
MGSEIVTVYQCKEYSVFYQDQPWHRYWKQFPDGKTSKIKGVSTISKMLDMSKHLIPWATELTAEYIIKKLPDILSGKLILTPDDAKKLFHKAKTENERVLKEAGDHGTKVHETVEQYLKAKYLGIGTLPTKVPEPVASSLESFKRLVKAIGLTRVIASERVMYSPTWDIGGTVDIVAEVNGRIEILDLKTSKGFYDDQFIQVAAYREIWNEFNDEKAEGVRIIRLDKRPPYLPYQKDFTAIQDLAFQVFLGLLEVAELKDKIAEVLKTG